MIRVFHLVKSLGRGGAEVLLAEGLRHSDRELFVSGYGYFLPWKSAMVQDLRDQGADVVCFDAKNRMGILWAVRRVARYMRDWEANIVHCHLPLAGIVGRIAGQLASVPVVYTEHNRMERYHPVTRMLNLGTWKWQDRVVAVSREVAASIGDHVRAESEVPVEVILNGIDIHRFVRKRRNGRSVKKPMEIPSDAPVVGTVAVFRRQKALHDWIEAARLLRLSHPNVHFVLVGDGPLRDELEAASRAAGLQEVIHFPGLKEEVMPYLEIMDVFMISSVFEGLPLALLEAMAMQCAVVATAVGGIPEAIRHGESGYLVEPGRPDLLARHVGALLDSREIARSFGTNARQSVEARFSMERMTRQLEDLYLSVLGRA